MSAVKKLRPRVATCSACHKEVVVGHDEPGIRGKGKLYHVSHAPVSLIDDAVEEWDAIMARGIEYFSEKYLPAGSAPKEGGSRLLNRFAEAGERLKSEARARRRK